MPTKTTIETGKQTGLEASLVVCFGIFIGLLYVFYRMPRCVDGDYLWHSVLARDILSNHAIPTQDTYSWRSIEMGYQEIAHSWLGSILLGTVVNLFATHGLLPLLGGRVFSLFWYLVGALTLRLTFYRGKVDWSFPVACILLAHNYGVVRIQNISDILFILLLFVLYRARSFRNLIWLPLITLACANIHGGTVVLFLGVMLAYTVWQFIPSFSLGIFEYENTTSRRMRFGYIGACVLSAVAALVNPYGFRLYTYFMHINDGFSTKYVYEWLPIQVTLLEFIFLFVIVLLPLLQRNRIALLKYGMVLGFLVLSFKHRRLSEYGLICASVLVLEYSRVFSEGWRSICLTDKVARLLPKLRKVCYTAVTASVYVLVFVIGFVVWVSLRTPEKTTPTFGELTEGAKEYLAEQSFERPFCEYNIGSGVIYAGFKSFIDSRADLFTGNELEDSASLRGQRKPAEELDAILEDYEFDAIILYSGNYFAGGSFGFQNYLKSKDDWELGYEDEMVVIYKHIGEY